ncbi:hypothetical protein COB11_02925 [Candidatus Aerophobetes bacterium]|uniref:MOMP-like family protein n=1 Tax=Aerophobetes bacterium TaxID=2030807 RepID=A0A2A4YKL7_UNCAE|nr:MAG: hypothetical protein COB11_02925 [Candidatus Aerophobetes bacterium]
MKLNLKKGLVLTSIALATTGFADRMQDSHSGDHFNDTYDQIKGTTITPNAGPVVSGGVDLFVSADFIYWYTTIDPSSVSSKVNSRVQSTDGSDSDTGGGNVKGPNSMDPGFKVAIGLDLKYDGWDTVIEYTWLHAKDTKTFRGGNTFIENFHFHNTYNVFSDHNVDSGKNNWTMRFNVIDWELGRNFFVSPKLTLRPHFGLKGAWHTNRLHLHLDDVNFFTDNGEVGTSVDNFYVRDKQSSWGLGIRSGLDTSWMFSRNWSLIGNFAITPMWSAFKTELRSRETDVVDVRTGQVTDISGELFENESIKDIQHMINMVFEFQLGFRWDYYFSDNDYRVRLQAAWEQQSWENHNQMYSYDGYDSLTMQGLTIKLRFDF